MGSENHINNLAKRAAISPMRVVLPEGSKPEIIQAACRAAETGVAKPILMGDEVEISNVAKQLGCSLLGIKIIATPSETEIDCLCDVYLQENFLFSRGYLRKKLIEPLSYAAMLVACDKADGMVAGLTNTTADVIIAAQSFVGMAAGIDTVSSMFLMDIPGYDGPEGSELVFADCAVCVDPSTDELVDIAISSAHTTERLLGWEPRVAMLSFSTKGSADSKIALKVQEATERIKERTPLLCVDGDLQLDAAIDPSVASRKISGESSVAGKANVLIFPNLFAGNICYKAVERLAGAHAYGPLLQGFAKPVSDLSRGSSAEDIFGAIVMVSICAQDGES